MLLEPVVAPLNVVVLGSNGAGKAVLVTKFLD
jgi:hypothetical protein